MKRLKIVCLHPKIKTVKDVVDYFQIYNKEIVDCLIWDESDPEYVIATEHIYNNWKYFNQFSEYYKNEKRIFVFHSGEAVFPDLNIFDYAIVINRELHNIDRIGRIPPSVFYARSTIKGITENTYCVEDAKHELSENKRQFCNFIYANPTAHPMREDLFYSLSRYKNVDSLGNHLNNTGVKSTRREKNWGEISVELKSHYKFTIASENALFDGYTTEKLLTTFQAHSVPIYWGNPYVAVEFNEKAFVNCHNYRSMKEIVGRVRQIDEDNDLWVEMVTAPWQTPEQISQINSDMCKYTEFLTAIFSQTIEDAKRRPGGTFPGMYYRWYFRKFRSRNIFASACIYYIKKRLKL